MVTADYIEMTVELLDGWQKALLDEPQRTLFIEWLSDHTQMDIQPEAFNQKVSVWLSSFEGMKEFLSEVLVIQSEIHWVFAQRELK